MTQLYMKLISLAGQIHAVPLQRWEGQLVRLAVLMFDMCREMPRSENESDLSKTPHVPLHQMDLVC
jgi:hypothetical protein